MSTNPPQPPESDSSTPSPSTSESATGPEAMTQPVTEPATEPVSEPVNEPVGEAIAASVVEVAAEPAAGSPSSPSPATATPASTATPAASTSQPSPADQVASAAKPNFLAIALRILKQIVDFVIFATPIVINVLSKLLQLLLKGLSYLRAWWVAILPKLRTRLPEPWKTQLPEPVITAIAVLSLVFVLGITTTLLSDHSAPIAEAPKVEHPSELPQPKQVAIDPAKLVKLQDQVAQITDQYAEGLVQSIQPSYRQNRLTVSLDNNWYRLDARQQDRLAEEVLKRSRKLKFDRLELTDPEGILVARSPVVGSNMLILEREKELPAVIEIETPETDSQKAVPSEIKASTPEAVETEIVKAIEEPAVTLPLSPEGI